MKEKVRSAQRVTNSEGPMDGGARRKPPDSSAQSEIPSTPGNSMHGNCYRSAELIAVLPGGKDGRTPIPPAQPGHPHFAARAGGRHRIDVRVWIARDLRFGSRNAVSITRAKIPKLAALPRGRTFCAQNTQGRSCPSLEIAERYRSPLAGVMAIGFPQTPPLNSRAKI